METHDAKAAIQHLIEHCTESRHPVGISLGAKIPKGPARRLRRAAERRGLAVKVCRDPDCQDPFHITLETEPN